MYSSGMLPVASCHQRQRINLLHVQCFFRLGFSRTRSIMNLICAGREAMVGHLPCLSFKCRAPSLASVAKYLPLSSVLRRAPSANSCGAEESTARRIHLFTLFAEGAIIGDRILLTHWRVARPIHVLSSRTVSALEASSSSALCPSAGSYVFNLCAGDGLQRQTCLARITVSPTTRTPSRDFSTSYLPKAALRRNRIPFHAFRTPRSSHPVNALREAEIAAAATASASHVAAPFTLQKQQRLYTLLCAEDERPVTISSLFSAAPSTHADSPLPVATSVHGHADVPRWEETFSGSTGPCSLPVGVSGLLKFRPSSTAATNFTFRGRVVRQLSIRRINHLGRNCTGQITVRYTGAGHFQRLRLVDFKRGRKDVFATVLRLEYDPGRSAHLALIQYDDGVLSYILAAQTTRPGDRVVASEHASITPANCLPLRCIPVGSIVHNIEIRPGAGGQLVRAAGCFATVVAKDRNFATLKLQSTEVRRFPLACWASIGQVSNSKQAARIRGKAGVSYWMGERPRTRGKAMNPVDHPHGGGTGKKGVKRPPVTKWGILCRGYKTRPKNKPLGFIVRRKKANKLIKKFGELGAAA